MSSQTATRRSCDTEGEDQIIASVRVVLSISMVGKRRPHKTRAPYKKVVGTGETSIDKDEQEATDESLSNLLSDKLGSPLDSSRDQGSQQEVAPPQGRDLPLELIDLVCSLCPRKHHLLLINRRWHVMALPHVYALPRLTPSNFSLFVEVITKYRELGSMVRELDLIKIAQVGKNSMVSRLLRRCSSKLELFRAPQSHFGYAPMISLTGCLRLKVLDLRLVSETLDLPQLFKAIQNFHDLEVLFFPRSSIRCADDAVIEWPRNLRKLGLSGGFPPQFLESTTFPETMNELYISNCPYMTTISLNKLLNRLGNQLTHISVVYPVPQLCEDAMDSVLLQCPNLVSLTVSIDYITGFALDPDFVPKGHTLRNLHILSSGLMGQANKIKPGDVLISTESLTNLNRVCVGLLLGWNPQNWATLGLAQTMYERGGALWMN